MLAWELGDFYAFYYVSFSILRFRVVPRVQILRIYSELKFGYID